MAVVKHGVSTDSPDRLLIDAGAVYLGFYDADSPGTLLGATRGGNTFELARTIRQMEADGSKGPVKGMRRIEEVVATLKVNMLEMTAENLRIAIADAIYASGMTTVSTEAVGTGNSAQTEFQLGFLIEDCEDAWDEETVANVTPTLDGGDFIAGAGSAKFAVASGASVGHIGTEVVDLVGNTLDDYESLGLRVKSTIAIKAGELQLLLDDSAECASPVATIDLPAIPANTWTTVMVPADFSGCTGLTIISVGINQTIDLGAFDLHIDQVKAVHGLLETNSEIITLGGGAQTRGTHYVMDYAKGEIQFAAAPGAQAVVCTYNYRTISTDAVLGGEDTELDKYNIRDDAYLLNVALVGVITGYSDPVIIKLTDALCDAGFSLSMAPKDEAVIELTFTAHYARTALDTEPWSVEYPAS